MMVHRKLMIKKQRMQEMKSKWLEDHYKLIHFIGLLFWITVLYKCLNNREKSIENLQSCWFTGREPWKLADSTIQSQEDLLESGERQTILGIRQSAWNWKQTR